VILKDQPQRQISKSLSPQHRPAIAGALEQVAAATTAGAADAQIEQIQTAADQALLQYRSALRTRIQAATAPGQAAMKSRLLGLGASRARGFLISNAIAAEIPASALNALERDPDIAHVVPDTLMKADLNVSSTALGSSAYWNAGIRGSGQWVGILDTGVDANHPAFGGAANVAGATFHASGATDVEYCDNSSTDDLQGHGTHVAAIAAGRGSTGWTAYYGVARAAKVYNLKAGFRTCSGGGAMYWSDMVDALDFAAFQTTVSVFNLSFGGPTSSDDTPSAQMIDAWLDAAAEDGLFMAVAAGNSGPGPNTVWDPGIAYNVVTVAAMDDKNTAARTDDSIAEYSSRGPTVGGRHKPDLAAPGSNITSAAHNWEGGAPDYVAFWGTSMAAPHIAGAAALMRQMGIHNALAQKAILINSADLGSNLWWSEDRGHGYANLTSAKATSQVTGVITPGTRLYFTSNASTASFKATLVWDRHIVSGNNHLSDLDMWVFDRSTGEWTGGAFGIQNVDQYFSLDAMSRVIVIDPFLVPAEVGSERFALALNRTGLTAVAPPSLTLSCTAPATITLGATFTLSCTVRNTGGLEALNVYTDLQMPSEWPYTPACNIWFGKVAANTSVVKTCSVTAGVVGTATLLATVRGSKYDDYLMESAAVNVTVVPASNGTSAITGYIRDSSWAPKSGVTVRLAGGATRAVVTDTQGRYIFSALAPAAYSVTPSLANWSFTPPNAVISLTSTAVALADFTAHQVQISGTVSGFDASYNTVPLAGVSVVLAGALSRSVTTNSAGFYSFTGLTPGGNYTVTPTPTSTQTFAPAKRVFTGLNSSVMASFNPAIKLLANNESSSATAVWYWPTTLTQDTATATWNSTESPPSCTGQAGSRSVWFRMQPNFTGTLLLDTFGTAYDTVLTVFDGSTSSGPELACNDDVSGLQSQIVLGVTAGQPYLIRVSGFGSITAGGRMVLNVIRP
jgi:subtilisin family serine protease